jgi:hypothetical protein
MNTNQVIRSKANNKGLAMDRRGHWQDSFTNINFIGTKDSARKQRIPAATPERTNALMGRA